jgi:2-dehydropantoate 2-reductase
MRIAVFGAGGIGVNLAASIAHGGGDVVLVCRGATLAAVRASGVAVTGARSIAVPRIAATDDVGTIGPVDAVILAVKLYDLETAARAIVPALGPDTLVVTTQNGVTARATIAPIVGESRAVAGSMYLSTFAVAPGVVRQKTGIGRMHFGEPDGRPSARTRALADALVAGGIDARVSADITADLWHKYFMLGGTAAVCGLSRQPIGVIRDDPALFALLLQAMREIIDVGTAAGVRFAPDALDKAMVFTRDADPATKVSMLEDLEAGRRTELEWLSGHASREGRRLGVPTPLHDVAYACLKPFADGRPAEARP